jgi:hypothetical protein
MTTITTAHPIVSTHHIVAARVTAAVSAGLTLAVVLPLTIGGNSAPVSRPAVASAPMPTGPGFVGTVNSGPDNPSRLSALCTEFENATPGSPAAFRLAETITAQGSC